MGNSLLLGEDLLIPFVRINPPTFDKLLDERVGPYRRVLHTQISGVVRFRKMILIVVPA
jgi:hypothetical protein